MLRSIDFKTMPYLFTDKAGTCLTVEFDGRELDDIYKQVKAMHDQAHSYASSTMTITTGTIRAVRNNNGYERDRKRQSIAGGHRLVRAA